MTIPLRCWLACNLILLVIAACGAAQAAGLTVPAPERPAPVVTGILRSAIDGAPLAGATVGLCAWRDADAEREALLEGRFVPETLTEVAADAQGRFSISVPSSVPIYLPSLHVPRSSRRGLTPPPTR